MYKVAESNCEIWIPIWNPIFRPTGGGWNPIAGRFGFKILKEKSPEIGFHACRSLAPCRLVRILRGWGCDDDHDEDDDCEDHEEDVDHDDHAVCPPSRGKTFVGPQRHLGGPATTKLTYFLLCVWPLRCLVHKMTPQTLKGATRPCLTQTGASGAFGLLVL